MPTVGGSYLPVEKFEKVPNSVRTTDNPPTAEVAYVASGIFNVEDVRHRALDPNGVSVGVPGIPLSITLENIGFLGGIGGSDGSVGNGNGGTLFLQDLKIEERGYQLYDVLAIYGQPAVTYEFSTTGGTFHLDVSYQTVATFPPGARNYKQAIGVKIDGNHLSVDGTDIVIPSGKITFKVRHNSGIVTLDFVRGLTNRTGSVNSTTWKSFPAGSLLFRGAEGSAGDTQMTELLYHFDYEQNIRADEEPSLAESDAKSVTFSTPTGDVLSKLSKDGHDYAWFVFVNKVDTEGRPTRVPEACYVERVYKRINFNDCFAF